MTGVVHCGHCGKPLYAKDGRGKPKRYQGVRYHCKGIHRGTGCGQWGVREPEILPYLVGLILEKIDRQELVQSEQAPRAMPKEIGGLERRLGRARADYDAGVKRFLRTSETRPELANDMADELAKWKVEISGIEDQLRSAKQGQDERFGLR